MDESDVKSIRPDQIYENVKDEGYNTVRIVCNFTILNFSSNFRHS
jgi:hypothetical protein